MVRIDRNASIAKLAAELPGAISVLEALGIDYSNAGERTLSDASHAEGIDPDVVIAGLRRLQVVDHVELWGDRSVTDLVRYLIARHHQFVRDELSRIALQLADLCASPAVVDPNLTLLRAAFVRLSEILLPHIHREEEGVFPSVEALEKKWQANEPPATTRGTLAANIRQLVVEHGVIAADLRALRELRQRLEHSSDLTPRCRGVLEDIATLEAHLHEYMFLENSALFPRALELETQAMV